MVIRLLVFRCCGSISTMLFCWFRKTLMFVCQSMKSIQTVSRSSGKTRLKLKKKLKTSKWSRKKTKKKWKSTLVKTFSNRKCRKRQCGSNMDLRMRMNLRTKRRAKKSRLMSKMYSTIKTHLVCKCSKIGGVELQERRHGSAHSGNLCLEPLQKLNPRKRKLKRSYRLNLRSEFQFEINSKVSLT